MTSGSGLSGWSVPINDDATNGGVTDITTPPVVGLDDTTPDACQGALINGFVLNDLTFSTTP